MSKVRTWSCAAAFALICLLAVNFLGRFTDVGSPLLGSVQWESAEVVTADGETWPVDANGDPAEWGLEEGMYLRLTSVLPEEGEIPGLYEDAFLLMETGSGEAEVLLDGEEYFRYEARDGGQNLNFQQLHLPLPPDAAGKTLTVLFLFGGEQESFLPVYARFSSENAQYAFSAAFYNSFALPAGAYSLGFVVLCAIFLVGLAAGSPDWSLLLLALAASLTTAREINMSSGTYFLSPRAYDILFSDGAYLAPIALLLLYLFLNRRHSVWRYLARVSLGTLAAAAAYFGYSRMTGGHFAASLTAVVVSALQGYPRDLLSWLNIYLLVACGGIAAYSMLQNMVHAQSEAKALALKNDLILDSYRNIEESVHRTSTMRHELKNYVAALDLLYRQGDMEGLGRRLGELRADTEQLSLPVYTDNYLVNAILQNAAARAGETGVRFQAQAPLPPELPVDEVDLCSLLINLMDNALEAAGAARAPEMRYITVRLKVNQGFLAVFCENGYGGTLRRDEAGALLTTKEDEGAHGLGLKQMESIARKYGSVLNISYTASVFTVQTALRLPKGGQD